MEFLTILERFSVTFSTQAFQGIVRRIVCRNKSSLLGLECLLKITRKKRQEPTYAYTYIQNTHLQEYTAYECACSMGLKRLVEISCEKLLELTEFPYKIEISKTYLPTYICMYACIHAATG
jgi:hypothetical protein